MQRISDRYLLIELAVAFVLLAGTFAMPRNASAALGQAGGSGPAIATTQLTDTVYHADGTTATGTVLVSWPAFTTSAGQAVPSGNTSVTIVTGGLVSLTLVPNAGSNPMGSYYTAVYHLDDGTVSREYWVVPVSATPVTIASIKSTVLPASVAVQTVTKSYVDSAIAAAVGSQGNGSQLNAAYVLVAGDSMTGPLILPADPVSASQAADKHYVDTSVAAVGGGSNGKVALTPSANQVVAQPTGTALSVNRLNGVEYASQYTSGGQANGIANATANTDCAAGCEVKADESYAATELLYPARWNSETHVEDTREGGRWDSYLNPEHVETPGIESGQAIDVTSTRSGAVLHQLTGSQAPASISLALSNEAPVGGSNLFPQSIDGTPPYFKSAYSALGITGTYNTQGQHVLVPRTTNCYGVGDCLIGSEFIYSSGGFRDEADEGAHPMDIQVSEDTHVFDGTCATGCSTGSTQLGITATSGAGTQGDGRFLIDTNAAKVISTGSLIGGAAGAPHAYATFSGTSFPLSTFFATTQKIVSQTSDVAPGTVTVAIATTGQPSGYSTSTSAAPSSTGIACIVDQTNATLPSNYETASYTTVDATHFQMTLKKPHNTPATVAIGGLCGYGLEQTVDTAAGIRQVFPVVGSSSATSLYYAGTVSAIVGHQGSTSAFVNASLAIATVARTGNLVTLTTSTPLPFDVNAVPLAIAGVADSSYDGTFTATTTGANTLTYTQSGANSTSTGGTASLLTGGFTLYPMAEVLSVFDQTAKSVDGQMTLAPNTVSWASGDAVEEPHFFQQAVGPDITYVTQTMPRPTSYVRAGVTYQGNNGPGLQGWSIANATPASNYFGNGGTHTAPDFAYQVSGIWARSMVLQAGEQSAFTVTCNSHGCGKWNSPFNLFELQSSAGTDTIQWQPGTSTLAFNLRGAPYSFSPAGFTGGTVNSTTINATTINATTINATTLTGALNASNLTAGTILAARLPLFGPSGVNHASGVVPDPGATAGTTHFLREDGTWAVPTGGGGGGSSSVAAFTSGTIDGTVIGGTTPAAGSFTTLNASTPIAAASGGTGSSAVPTAGQISIGNTGGTGFAPQSLSGDCLLSSTGAIVCAKVNGVAFGTAATTATTAYDAAGAATTAQAASLQKSNNLSDLASAAAARSSLGLGAAATQPASITINGAACALGGSCSPNSFAALPQQSNVLADYQLADGTGTAPADSSGNGNTGSFPGGAANPTWTSQGLTFNASGASGQYFASAGTTNAKSIMIAYTTSNPTTNNGPLNPTFWTLFGNSSLAGLNFYSASQLYGNLGYMNKNGAAQTGMSGSFNGTHVLVVVLGCAGCAYTIDQYYLDGQSVGTQTGTATYGNATGIYNVGGSPTGYDTYLSGSIYRATFWSTQLSNFDAAAAAGLTRTLETTRGVNFFFNANPSTAPQLVATGDSLTNGEGVTPYVNFLSTQLTYTTQNYGIGNISATTNASLMNWRERQAFAPLAPSNVDFIWNGTNDVSTYGLSAQAASNAIWSECTAARSYGFKAVVATMISRTAQDTAKDTLNTIIRDQWAQHCDALSDFAANPLVGADGANSGTPGTTEACPGATTYYQADCIHLNQTGQQNVIAPMASHTLDSLYGSTPQNCDPVVVTASTYTSTAQDGCKTFNAASNAIVDTLPSAVGYTGRVIRRCNDTLSGSNSVTIAAPSDNPFNGVTGTSTIAIPNNTCKEFKGTIVSASASGAYWQQFN